MSSEREIEPAIERAKRLRNQPFPKYYDDVWEWLWSLQNWLMDPTAARVVENVREDLRERYDAYEDYRAKIEDKLDQVECELQDMREKFGALLQQHIELCAQYGVEKGEHRSNGARP